MSGNVRPNMIMLALKDLLHTPLYKSLNIKIHHAWDSLFAIHMNTKTQHNCVDENDIFKDNFEECFEDISTETMIHNFLDSDIINDYDKMLIVAPSEDYHPISIFKDKYSEELNFPTLFYGYPRNQNIYDKFFQHAIAKWEFLHKNHDFAQNIQNIFFKAIKICIQKVKNSSWIRIRKRKLTGRTLTTNQIIQEPNLDKILQSHIGFRDLERLRTFPYYTQGLRKNCLQ